MGDFPVMDLPVTQASVRGVFIRLLKYPDGSIREMRTMCGPTLKDFASLVQSTCLTMAHCYAVRFGYEFDCTARYNDQSYKLVQAVGLDPTYYLNGILSHRRGAYTGMVVQCRDDILHHEPFDPEQDNVISLVSTNPTLEEVELACRIVWNSRQLGQPQS